MKTIYNLEELTKAQLNGERIASFVRRTEQAAEHAKWKLTHLQFTAQFLKKLTPTQQSSKVMRILDFTQLPCIAEIGILSA